MRSDHSRAKVHFSLILLSGFKVKKKMIPIHVSTEFRTEKSTWETRGKGTPVSPVVVVIIEECVLVVRPQWTCAFFLNFPHSAESQASATEAKLPPNVFPCEETGLHALCAWRSRYEKERACKYHHLACQAPVPKLVNQMSHASSLWWGQRKNGIVPSYISAEN